MVSYIQTDSKITVVFAGSNARVVNIDKTHHNYQKVRSLLKAGSKNRDLLLELIDVKERVEKDGFSVTLDEFGSISQIEFEGFELHSSLFKRVKSIIYEQESTIYIKNFIKNLHENPSETSRKELYGFLENNDLPLTNDGYFLAYKFVNNDYFDSYTGVTHKNNLGSTIEMPREDVDSDRDTTCSVGLHFCSYDYVSEVESGKRLLILCINPKDVVSIPSDYNQSKGRCCRYSVVGEIPAEEFMKGNIRIISNFVDDSDQPSLFNNIEDEDEDEDYDANFDETCYDEDGNYDEDCCY